LPIQSIQKVFKKNFKFGSVHWAKNKCFQNKKKILVANAKVGLEANTEETWYMFMSREYCRKNCQPNYS
jgi:hypothetical protein